MRHRYLISAFSRDDLSNPQEQTWQRLGPELQVALTATTQLTLAGLAEAVLVVPDPSSSDLADVLTVRITRPGVPESYATLTHGSDYDALLDRPLFSTVVRGSTVVTKMPPL